MTTRKSGLPGIVVPDPPVPGQESQSENPKPKGNKKRSRKKHRIPRQQQA